MSHLSYSIVILSNAYIEVVFASWLNKYFYGRTVDLMRDVCLL